jgi:hypothetical protein
MCETWHLPVISAHGASFGGLIIDGSIGISSLLDAEIKDEHTSKQTELTVLALNSHFYLEIE